MTLTKLIYLQKSIFQSKIFPKKEDGAVLCRTFIICFGTKDWK